MIKLENVVLASPEQMKDFRCKCTNKPIDNRPQIIMGTRGSGKTTSLIKEAQKTDGIIVCPHGIWLIVFIKQHVNLDIKFESP